MESIKLMIKHNMRQYAMLAALIVITIFFQVLSGGILLEPINVHRLIMQNSYILILAIGMVICILTGGNIDLSVGSIVAFVSATSALFSVKMGMPVVLAITLSLICGLLAGMWQGFWIAYVNIPSFIVTLAGMLVFRGINNMILNGETISLPDLYVTLASGNIPDVIGGPNSSIHVTTLVIGIICAVIYAAVEIIGRKRKQKFGFKVSGHGVFVAKVITIATVIVVFMLWLAMARGLLFIVILLAALIGIYTFITQKTVMGRHIYALGGNAKTAALSGIKTKKILFLAYANMGLMSAIAGIIFAGRLNASSPVAGQGFELDAIAACFIGGASASGGVGTVIGAIIGGLIMGILNNGMSILGYDIFLRNIIKGLVLLAAVAFDVYSKSKSKAA